MTATVCVVGQKGGGCGATPAVQQVRPPQTGLSRRARRSTNHRETRGHPNVVWCVVVCGLWWNHGWC